MTRTDTKRPPTVCHTKPLVPYFFDVPLIDLVRLDSVGTNDVFAAEAFGHLLARKQGTTTHHPQGMPFIAPARESKEPPSVLTKSSHLQFAARVRIEAVMYVLHESVCQLWRSSVMHAEFQEGANARDIASEAVRGATQRGGTASRDRFASFFNKDSDLLEVFVALVDAVLKWSGGIGIKLVDGKYTPIVGVTQKWWQDGDESLSDIGRYVTCVGMRVARSFEPAVLKDDLLHKTRIMASIRECLEEEERLGYKGALAAQRKSIWAARRADLERRSKERAERKEEDAKRKEEYARNMQQVKDDAATTEIEEKAQLKLYEWLHGISEAAAEQEENVAASTVAPSFVQKGVHDAPKGLNFKVLPTNTPTE